MPLLNQDTLRFRQPETAEPARQYQESSRERIYRSIRCVLKTLKSPACTPTLISELQQSTKTIIAASKQGDEYWPFIQDCCPPLRIEEYYGSTQHENKTIALLRTELWTKSRLGKYAKREDMTAYHNGRLVGFHERALKSYVDRVGMLPMELMTHRMSLLRACAKLDNFDCKQTGVSSISLQAENVDTSAQSAFSSGYLPLDAMYVFMIRRDIARASIGLSLVKAKLQNIWLKRKVNDVIVAINAFDGQLAYVYAQQMSRQKITAYIQMPTRGRNGEPPSKKRKFVQTNTT